MLRSVIRFSIRFPWLVIAIAVGLVALGILQFSNARKDLLPEFSPVTVEVQTEALGLSAYEVEQLITVPLEQDLLNGVAFLQDIESASLPGLSSVVMTFEPGTDILDARQVVAERLTQAVAVAGLPNVADTPQMIQPLSSTSRVALVSLSSSSMSPIEQSVQARWVIVPALLGVDGVANVSIFGFRDRQLQVLADPQRLAMEQLDLADVIRTSGNALEVSPLSFLEASSPGTGGFIDTANQRLHIFHEQAISTPEELGQVPIEDDEGVAVIRNGQPLLLGDVTDIVEDHQPLIGDARCEQGPCLLLVIEKFPEANTPAVAAGVNDALESLAPGLPGLDMDTSLYEPASFIDSSLVNLGVVLAIGALVLVVVLGLVFRDWRTTVIGVSTIVVSLAAAVVVLLLFDVTVNTMVLGGLVMALALIIDQAVTGAGRLRREATAARDGTGALLTRSVLGSTLENGRPALYALAIAVATLVPFYMTGGIVGAFFPEMATAYLVALAVALMISMMVGPALGILLLGRSGEVSEPPFASRLRSSYEEGSASRSSLAAPLLTLGALVVAAAVSVSFFETKTRPSLQERDVVVSLAGPPGMSLPRMDAITANVVEEIEALPGIDAVATHVGRAITSDQIVDVNVAEVWVSMSATAPYDDTFDAIEVVAGSQSEVNSEVSTYSEQRMTEVLGGQAADEVVVRVYGEDDQTLISTAEEARDLISGVEGVEEAVVLRELEQDTIEVEVDLAAAQAHGLKPGDIRRTAAILLSGITVGNLFEEQKVFDVVVWGPPEMRATPDDVGNLVITTPTRNQIRLSEVADVRVISSPTVIRHESVSKYIDVSVTVADGNVSAVAGRVEAGLEQIDFPPEFHAAVLGDYEEANATRATVISVAIASLIAIYLLLQSAFSSWRLATLAFLLLPLALTGSIIATLAFSREWTLGLMAGLVAIFALATRWILTLVRRFQALEREGVEFGPALVASGTSEVLLLMLGSGAAIVGFFLPAVIRSGTAGLEIVGPMAIAVVGGVATTLTLALFVFPAAYARWGHVENPDTSAEDLFVDHELQPETV